MTVAASEERPVIFASGGASLVGILHLPASPRPRGVVIVVGGPQYRTGSHRQFLLLARSLADAGHAVLRFDHRGIGDSDGPYPGFEALDGDIAAAIDALVAHCPQVGEVVLWGLCDAASAILFYAHKDTRVRGIVLLNPWVRTPESEARTYLRHYYARRLTERDFWSGLMAGKVRPAAAAGSLFRFLARRFTGARAPASEPAADARPLPDRMAEGLARFAGPVLLVMSGQDLTAREFDDAAQRAPAWRRLLAEDRVRRLDLAAADHTFSRRAWRDRVSDWTLDWLRSW